MAWFERLTYLSLIIGSVFGFVLHPTAPTLRLLAKHGIVFFIAAIVIGLGLYALAIWSIARRRKNWVRWLLLILFVTGLPWALKDNLGIYRTDPATAIERTIGELIQGLAFCFVFSADARPWFQKRPEIDPDIFS